MLIVKHTEANAHCTTGASFLALRDYMPRRRRTYRRNKRPPTERLPYKSRGKLLSRGEMAFYVALRRAVAARYLIAFKVRAADLLACSDESWESGFGHMIARHHLDFVLCDLLSTTIVAAIELDDKSHILHRRQRRDAFLNEAFDAARIPLIRFRAKARYDIKTIDETLDQHLSSPATNEPPIRQHSRELDLLTSEPE
jgi:hypothetical protein